MVSITATPTNNVSTTLCTNSNIQFKLEYEEVKGDNNAGVTALDSLDYFCAGNEDVYARIANLGQNRIDSLNVHWEVNNIAQPSIQLIALLDSIGGTLSNDTLLKLGNVNLIAGSNHIKIYTDLPNGVADTVNSDDTLELQLLSARIPENVTLSNLNKNSVTVDVLNYAGSLEFEVGLSGFTPGGGNRGTATTTPFTVNRLIPTTNYDLYVRSDCGTGDKSNWLGPISFKTAIGIPYRQDFESFNPGIFGNPWPENWSSTTTTDPNWESEDATGNNENSVNTGPLYDHTQFGVAGGTYVYMETSGGRVGDSADFISPIISVDSNQRTLKLSYWYFNHGSDIDKMQVFITSNGQDSLIAEYIGEQQLNQTDNWRLATHTLTGFQSKNISIKFRGFNVSCCSGDVAIDDILIENIPKLNLSLNEVVQPSANEVFCSGYKTLNRISVSNTGSDQIDSIALIRSFNGILDTAVFLLTLPSNTTDTISWDSVTFLSGNNKVDLYVQKVNNTQDNYQLDDTIQSNIATANPPTTFELLNSSTTSVEFNIGSFADSADYEVGLSGFTQGQGSTGMVDSLPFTVSGLTASSEYDIYFRTNCGMSDVSSWAGPFQFKTAIGIPFSEDFEGFAAGITGNPWPNEWTTTTTTDPNWESEDATGFNENSIATGPLYDHTQFGVNGGTYIYMETSGGITGDSADLVSPWIYVDTNQTVVKLSYWYFNHGSNIDRMQVVVEGNGTETILVEYVGEQQADQADDWLEASHLLVGYQGANIRIKFRGFDVPCCSGDIAVDDIKLDEVPKLNMIVNEMISPAAEGVFCPGSTENIELVVANGGINAIDSFAIVSGLPGSLDTSYFYQGIPSGGVDTIVLPAISFIRGLNTIQAYFTQVNGGPDAIQLDDTLRTAIPIANPPLGYSILNVTENSIEINIEGVADSIEYEIGLSRFNPGSGTLGVVSSIPFKILGLSSGTTYDVYLRSKCMSGELSAWVGPIEFTTSFGIPFIQDFESFNAGITGNPWPMGWSSTTFNDPNWESEDANGNNENSTNTGPLYDHTIFGQSGGNYIYMETSGGSLGDTATFISPRIYLDSSQTTVSLSYWYFNHGSDINRMDVIVDTNSSEYIIETYLGQQQFDQAQEWRQGFHYLSGYQGQSIQIKFRGYRGFSFRGDVAIDDVEIEVVPQLNASLTSIINPSNQLCPGSLVPLVEIQNKGIDTLKTIDVVFEVNGIKDTAKFSVNLETGAKQQLALPARSFSSGILYSIKAYTILPNGGVDGLNSDDTLSVENITTGLSGTVSINPSVAASATNFTSFNSLQNQIDATGICGNVLVNVSPGTYNESLLLDNINGLGANSRLTIDGGSAASVTLRNNSTTEAAAIHFINTSYVTIKNMTIRGEYTGFSEEFGVFFSKGSNYDSIVDCRILMDLNAGANVFGVGAADDIINEFSEGDNANFTTIMNCEIEGGSRSIHFEGGSAANWNVGNSFINNDLSEMDDGGIFADEQDSLSIIGNSISKPRSTFGSGIELFDPMNFKVNANEVRTDGISIFINDANSTKTPDQVAEMINNMALSTNNHAIRLTNAFKVKLLHNSTRSGGSVSSFYLGTPGLLDSMDVRNNVFYSEDNLAFRIDNPDTMVFLRFDHNVFYSSGQDLLEIETVRYNNLSTYQSAQPRFNINSLDGDPQFTSPTDLHIIGRFINDKGDNSVLVFEDIDGDVRPTSFSTVVDLGADEFDIPFCTPPIKLAVGSLSDSVVIQWESGVLGNSVIYEYGLKGFVLGTGTVGSSSVDSVVLKGLFSSTDYDLYVREVCGRGDSSAITGPLSFKTPCLPISVDYFNDFESNGLNIAPDCWEEYATYTSGYAQVRNGFAASAFSGSQALVLYSNFGFATGDSLLIVSNELEDVTSGDKRVRFRANVSDITNALVIATADKASGRANFTPIDTILFGSALSWNEYTVDLTTANGYNGTDEFIAFSHSLDGTFDYIRIDDFNYEKIPTCFIPTNLTAGSNSSSSAQLNWNENNSATQWQIEYGVLGFNLGRGTRITTTTKPFSLSGLSAATSYDVYVRSICTAGDTSKWSSKQSFVTNCQNLVPVRTLPWVEGFENYTDSSYIGDNIVGCDSTHQWNFVTENQSEGRVYIGTDAAVFGGTASGRGAAVMDILNANVNGTVPNGLILTLNLDSFRTNTDLSLEFYARDFGDEDHPGDSIWFRGWSGDPWVGVFDIGNVLTGSWRNYGPLDIDNLLAQKGQVVSSSFQVRFGQEDDFALTTDGIAYDSIRVSGGTIVSIDEQINTPTNRLEVYPNPSNGLFNLHMQSGKRISPEIRVTDLNGKEVYYRALKVVNGELLEELDLSNLAKGVYYLHVNTKEESRVKKLVIW